MPYTIVSMGTLKIADLLYWDIHCCGGTTKNMKTFSLNLEMFSCGSRIFMDIRYIPYFWLNMSLHTNPSQFFVIDTSPTTSHHLHIMPHHLHIMPHHLPMLSPSYPSIFSLYHHQWNEMSHNYIVSPLYIVLYSIYVSLLQPSLYPNYVLNEQPVSVKLLHMTVYPIIFPLSSHGSPLYHHRITIPSSKLTWQWKLVHLQIICLSKRRFSIAMLPEGKSVAFTPPSLCW